RRAVARTRRRDVRLERARPDDGIDHLWQSHDSKTAGACADAAGRVLGIRRRNHVRGKRPARSGATGENRRTLAGLRASDGYNRGQMSTNVVNRPLDENTADFFHEAAHSKFDFHQVSVKAAGDEKLKAAINNAVLRQYTGRQLRLMDLPDADALRTLAGEIKQHTLDYLDYYLDQLVTNVERNGGQVH